MTTIREFEKQQERELRGLSKTTDCGLIQPNVTPGALSALTPAAPTPSAEAASAGDDRDDAKRSMQLRVKIESLAAILQGTEKTKQDIVADDGETVTGVRIGWGAWALLRAKIIDVIETKCEADAVRAGGQALSYRLPAAQQGDDDRINAERWRALIGCARIRVLGAAGFGQGVDSDLSGYRHFGAEFWTIHPGCKDTFNGADVLTKFADVARERAAHNAGEKL